MPTINQAQLIKEEEEEEGESLQKKQFEEEVKRLFPEDNR